DRDDLVTALRSAPRPIHALAHRGPQAGRAAPGQRPGNRGWRASGGTGHRGPGPLTGRPPRRRTARCRWHTGLLAEGEPTARDTRGGPRAKLAVAELGRVGPAVGPL